MESIVTILKASYINPVVQDIRVYHLLHVIACCWRFDKEPNNLTIHELMTDTKAQEIRKTNAIFSYIVHQNKNFDEEIPDIQITADTILRLSKGSLCEFILSKTKVDETKINELYLKETFARSCSKVTQKLFLLTRENTSQVYHGML